VGDGKACADEDECALGTAGCDPHAACVNTPGSFACACLPGWSGTGAACAAVCGDAIIVGNEECDDANGVQDDACSNGCAINPTGDGCEGAPALAAGVAVGATTAGAHPSAALDPACAPSASAAPDVFRTFAVEAGWSYAVSASPEAEARVTVRLRSACETAACPLAAGTSAADGATATAWTAPTGAGVLVVQVLTESGPAGPVSLLLQAWPPTEPADPGPDAADAGVDLEPDAAADLDPDGPSEPEPDAGSAVEPQADGSDPPDGEQLIDSAEIFEIEDISAVEVEPDPPEDASQPEDPGTVEGQTPDEEAQAGVEQAETPTAQPEATFEADLAGQAAEDAQDGVSQAESTDGDQAVDSLWDAAGTADADAAAPDAGRPLADQTSGRSGSDATATTDNLPQAPQADAAGAGSAPGAASEGCRAVPRPASVVPPWACLALGALALLGRRRKPEAPGIEYYK
jgi:hypothetical protein